MFFNFTDFKDTKMKILIVTSELAPFAKSGGLADVASALAINLKQRGHDVRIVLPHYALIKEKGIATEVHQSSMCVTMGQGEEWCSLNKFTTPENVPVFLIDHTLYFDRPLLYHDKNMEDYQDNARRFGFFCRAALQYCIDQDFTPDIIHTNDWQTAPVTAYLKTWFWNQKNLKDAASVLTIHNIGYQGNYPEADYNYLGLGEKNFNSEIFESCNNLNMLKGGIHFADMVNTVSCGHADEITAPCGGFGLAPYLSNKGDAFCGILNGVDYDVWSPETDNLIETNYSIAQIEKKKECKRALQREFNLTEDENICLIGTIGRFVWQKGFHLINEIIEGLLSDMHIQFVVLGSGEKDIEHHFGSLPARFPGKTGSYIGYNERLSHIIEAGCDFYLMPSMFEPCGLNQMYSLKYGTLPIVSSTGGLNDTIQQYDEKTGTGTGFKFNELSPSSLYYTIGWAVSTYYDRPKDMEKMIKQAMEQDFSWDRSILAYEDLYNQAIAKKQQYNKLFI